MRGVVWAESVRGGHILEREEGEIPHAARRNARGVGWTYCLDSRVLEADVYSSVRRTICYHTQHAVTLMTGTRN